MGAAGLTCDKVAAAYDDFSGRSTRLALPALRRAAARAPGQRVPDVAKRSHSTRMKKQTAVARPPRAS